MTNVPPLDITAKLAEHEPLARYTSWRIGGQARYFAAAASADELQALVAWGQARALPIFILGGGTNILMADGGYPAEEQTILRHREIDARCRQHSLAEEAERGNRDAERDQ